MIREGPGGGSRSQRLRARRIRVDVVKFGEVSATALHTTLGPLKARVEDLSLHGMALVVGGLGSQAQLIMAGDRLEQLTVRCADRLLFQGGGTVRRVVERGADFLVGTELESDGIDLNELYREGTRQSFAERWQMAQQRVNQAEVSPAFKAWVADLRTYLEASRSFLDVEERAIETEDLLKRRHTRQQYLDEVAPHIGRAMESAGAELCALVKSFDEVQHASCRAFCRVHLAPLFAHSPFMRRAFEKPLGYAGDYEMMNMLYRDHAEGTSLFGQALNVYATQEAAARANINRIEYLGEKIRAAVAMHPLGTRLRVASIGCGPAREIGALLERSPALGSRLDVALIDQEERSIEYCERTLAPLAAQTGARIQFIRESIRRFLTARQLSQTLGGRELIYSAGLFDYLNERSFAALLAALFDALTPGGLLAVGNVGMHNPSRFAMEYFSDWFLHHRTPPDLQRLAASLPISPASVSIDAEPLGLNLFLLVSR